MKFLKRVAMSAALILFGATAVAQEVKENLATNEIPSRKIVVKATNGTAGLTLSPANVIVYVGEKVDVNIVYDVGYDKAYLVENERLVTAVSGDCFTAELIDEGKGPQIRVSGVYHKTVSRGSVEVTAMQAYSSGSTGTLSTLYDTVELIITVLSK